MARTVRVHDIQTAGALAVGAHRFPLSVEAYSDVGLQWVVESATPGASATIAIYASALRYDDSRLANLNPTTNPYWSATTIVFTAVPGAGAGSDFVPISDNGAATLLLEITVAGAPYTDLALLISGMTRA